MNSIDTGFYELMSNENVVINQLYKDYETLKCEIKNEKCVDVLICIYNSSKHLSNALKTILYQTYQNFKIVVVADPCNDNSIDILNGFVEKFPNKFIVKINKERQGFIGSLNQGLEMCQSSFILRMDTDDLMHPQRIEKQLKFLENNPKIDVVSSFMKQFNENGFVKNITYRLNADEHKVTSLFYSPLSHAASMFRANVIKQLKYREGYLFAEDYDLWTRILKKHNTSVIGEYLYLYRAHNEQTNIESNLEKLKLTERKIITNIFDDLKIVQSDDMISFHIESCLHRSETFSTNDFIKFDYHFKKIIFANRLNQNYNENTLINFLFLNYWQSYFTQFYNQIKFKDLISLLKSPICRFSYFLKLKYIIKKIIKS